MGAIVNISSSTGAHDAKGNTVAYVTSKGAVTLMTKAMAIDHARTHVRVNAPRSGPNRHTDAEKRPDPRGDCRLCPTFPMGRLGRPEELAHAALFLASVEASFVTGAILAVGGGQTADA